MKISVLQQDLLPPLQAVSRSVGVRASLPVLDNVLLSASSGRLKIATTNLEIGVIKYLSLEVIEEGEITVPAKTLVELTAGLGPVKLELETRGDLLGITSGKFKAVINGITASEFPVIPVSKELGVTFKKEELGLVAQILFSAAVDEGRPVLTGILTDLRAGSLDFVATDGFRLAHRQVKLENQKAEFKTLIPRRTLEEVLRVVAEEQAEDVGIDTSSTQNQAIFTIGQTIVSSRLIEGQFPAWERIIPTQFVARAVVDKDQAQKAIKVASVFAKNEANIVVAKLNQGQLILESSSKELGSQENEVEGQVEGEDLQIAFNAKFLADAVSACPASQLMVEFSGPLSPALIKPVGVEGLQYIVMPVRLS